MKERGSGKEREWEREQKGERGEGREGEWERGTKGGYVAVILSKKGENLGTL